MRLKTFSQLIKNIKMEESRNLKVVVTSREKIKPSSPSSTSKHQRSFKLSLLDQFSVQHYVPILLFYKGTTPPIAGSLKDQERSKLLKSSLSQTLTHFYPFAGRLEDHLSFNCNDEGVEYLEAQVLNSSLSSVLQKPDPKLLSLFLPPEEEASCLSTRRPPFLVQVSFFGCGGMVLGMKSCHKIADAATLSSFITSWANSAIRNMNSMIPDFSASTLFPPIDSLLPFPPQVEPPHQEYVSSSARESRFVFGPSSLAALQAEATSGDVPQPTRFEAVSAFLWKTASQAKKETRHGCPKPSVFLWAVNLRSKLQPPLPEHCFGNLVALPIAHDQGEDIDGIDHLPIMAGHLKLGTKDICNHYVKTTLEEKEGRHLRILELQMNMKDVYGKSLGGAIDSYVLSSWCKFPLYEADFGWGKPVWVTSVGSVLIPNMMLLMDTRDGLGIEAWVCLMEDDMTVFERNQELQKYASFNPSVIVV